MEDNCIDSKIEKIGARRYVNAKEDWLIISEQISYLPNNYSTNWLRDYLAYHKGHGLLISDLSLVLYHDKKPCGIWPLNYVSGVDNPLRIVGESIVPPLFIPGLTVRVIKSMTKSCFNFIDEVLAGAEGKYWESTESFNNGIGISEWQHQSLSRGATSHFSHEVFVDLSLDMMEIKKSFRKRYKSLINSGLRHWEVSILDEPDEEIWDEYRMLHREVSGRTTRSRETWELQLQSIKEGKAFLIFLREEGGRMIGGGYFNVTDHECVYITGVYDRNLFDIPLGHAVQYRAIEEMKARGLLWYKLGDSPYKTDLKEPTDKELTIANFKQGFSTHIFPKYNLKYEY